jgi:hypothetical protein
VEDVGNDLQEMKVKTMRQKAMDKEERAYVLKEARLLEDRTAKLINLNNAHLGL